jgi:hypothetical protein
VSCWAECGHGTCTMWCIMHGVHRGLEPLRTVGWSGATAPNHNPAHAAHPAHPPCITNTRTDTQTHRHSHTDTHTHRETHTPAADHDWPRRLAVQQDGKVHLARELHLLRHIQRVDRLACRPRLLCDKRLAQHLLGQVQRLVRVCVWVCGCVCVCGCGWVCGASVAGCVRVCEMLGWTRVQLGPTDRMRQGSRCPGWLLAACVAPCLHTSSRGGPPTNTRARAHRTPCSRCICARHPAARL